LSRFSHYLLSFWLCFITLTSGAHSRQKTHLTKRSSQPLAVPMCTFNFMKQFREFATLAPASGG